MSKRTYTRAGLARALRLCVSGDKCTRRACPFFAVPQGECIDKLKLAAADALESQPAAPDSGPMPWRLQIAKDLMAGMLASEGEGSTYDRDKLPKTTLELADALIAAQGAQPEADRG